MAITQQTQTDDEQTEIKQQFAAEFGDIEPPQADQFDFEGCVVGEENITMWSPDNQTDPNGIELTEYTPADSFGMQYAPVDGDLQRVYVINNGTKSHVINADNVDALAEIVDQTPADLINATARTNTDYANYVVLFDLPAGMGNAMFAPICVTDDELVDNDN